MPSNPLEVSRIPVLVVDDEPTLRSVLRQVLEDDGYFVTDAPCAEQALESFRQRPVPLVISDIVMGKMSGLELLREIKQIEPETLVIMMTSHASLEAATNALRSGAYDFLLKPFEDITLISAVAARASEKIRLTESNRELVESLRRKAEELEHANSMLRELAERDGLTGLHNHRYFREALDRELARSARHRRLFSLVMIDIDHFKRFNDTYGHLAGDEALKHLAGILQNLCRSSSVVARYGGEEFVMIVPENDSEGARVFADRVRDTVELTPFRNSGEALSLPLTISLGISTFPEDGIDARTLIQRADKALYYAKADGRNTVRCYREAMALASV
jgi:two-component system, cell cycle response regulator